MSGMFGGGGINPYDDIVAKTTDENLTSENWELILNLCDKVSDEGNEGARHVLSSLLKRLSHRNPNVQLYTLSLADALSKNCGLIVNREIASRAFTSGLEKLVTDRNTHDKVKKRALGLVKEWTEEWEGQDELGIMEECYLALKKKNYNFDAINELPPPAVDDEIRRREEEELQRVLEMSMQDRGGYSSSSWAQPSGAGSSSSQSNGANRNGYVPSANPSAASSYAQSPATTTTTTTNSTSNEPARGTAGITSSLGSMTIGSSTSLNSTLSMTKRSNRVRALHPFTPTEPGELAFSAGDIITVVDRNYKDWWRGQLRGRTGIFPVNYVEVLPPPDEAELARESQQEAAVFAEATNVERLLEMLRDLDRQQQEYNNSRAQSTPPSRLADNDELQELYRSCMALRPKIVKLIEKYSQKRADLVSMNETFVRARGIFERLMEESLAGYGGGGVYPPNVYGGGYPTAGPLSPSSYGGPQLGYHPTPTPGPYPQAYPGPVQGPVQALTASSPVLEGVVPPGVGTGVPQGVVGQGQQPISAYEALYGQRAQQQGGRYPLQGQGTPGVLGLQGPAGQGVHVSALQTYPQQQPQPGQTQQAQAQQQPQLAVQQTNTQSLPQAQPSSQQSHQVQPRPAQQQQSQPQPQPAQQSSSSPSGPPPYIYSPTTTYPDPNVQAWAQYYAQGGKDSTGAVYFVSVPGVKEPPEGTLAAEQRRDQEAQEAHGVQQTEQVQLVQQTQLQSSPAQVATQTQPSYGNSPYGPNPHQAVDASYSSETTASTGNKSTSSLPLPYPGSDSAHVPASRSSTIDSSFSTATGGSLPNPYGAIGGDTNTGTAPGASESLERSSSLPYPGDAAPLPITNQNVISSGSVSPSSPHANSYSHSYHNTNPSNYSSSSLSSSLPLRQSSTSPPPGIPPTSFITNAASPPLALSTSNVAISNSPQISTSTPSWLLPKMGQGHFVNPAAGTRTD
ncbi:hypothetical protein F5890DRAFT_1557764 [Lentinula detonsa]|uniref:Class E vacuolar protein-sorting machinery protein HSE1 n=1 Tax=Lentinula detonsa TaxID=2804962 RepID=A0AA38UNA4_9AGAR|nr:hypothetical protein F5890DRAFT_1557764 [Lentinula detonsa]